MKKTIIDIPMFKTKVTIIETGNLCELNPVYKTRVPYNSYDAIVFTDETEGCIAAFQTDCVKPTIIVHECIHIVNHIFDEKGIMLDKNNDETQAYFTEWMFEQVTNTLGPK